MNLIINLSLTILSLFFLIKGASLVLKGAISIARKNHLSDLVIGSTIVAFGTVLPSIATNLALLFAPTPNFDIALGNMIGTNYVNLGLALGIPAFMTTIVTKYNVFEKEIPMYLALCAILSVFVLGGDISQIEGLVLFVFYILIGFIVYQYSLREKKEEPQNLSLLQDQGKESETAKSGLHIFAGIVVLIVASFLLTYTAPLVARDLGISQYLVGLTIIGIGTSLPTIAASIEATKKGYIDIVLGNVFGGNIINIGLGIGLPAIFRALPVSAEGLKDIYFTNIYNFIILLAVLIELKLLGGNKALSRVSGLIIIAIYGGYLISKIF